MDHLALDRILAFNRHLGALAEAGVPLDLATDGETEADALKRYDAQAALAVGRGQSLSSAIAEEGVLPGAYRAAALAALASDDADALDLLYRPACSQQRLQQTALRSLTVPLILAALALVAFSYVCLHVSPTFEAIYEQIDRQPAAITSLLAHARSWLPVWAPLAAAAILVVAAACRRQGVASLWQWLPGVRRYLAAERNASFAHRLARLSEGEIPLDDALPLAAAAPGERRLLDGALAIAAAGQRGEPVDRRQDSAAAFPPLLRWALMSEPDPADRARNLRIAAESYARAAQRQAARWRQLAPVLIAAAAGGLIVLAYGLVVFTPIVQLLETLAGPLSS